MKKARLVGKKALSIILTLAMLLTTVVFFNIGVSAADNAPNIDVTANEEKDVYLYVPEQIYLEPKVDSYKNQQRYNFQWFVDSTVNDITHVATPRTGENDAGNFYFFYEYATNIKVTFKYLKQDGTELTAYTNTSDSTTSADWVNYNSQVFFASGTAISASNTRSAASSTTYTVQGNKINTQLTRSGLSPTLLASTSGCYIEWTVRFNDSRDGIERAVKAYTYVYKPFTQPVGVAVRAAEEYWDDHYNQFFAWVSGVHSSTDGSYFPKSGGGGGSAVPFSSSNNKGYQRGNLMMQFSSSVDNGPDNYFDWSASNDAVKGWFSTDSSTNFTQKTFNFGSDANNNPSGTKDLTAWTFVASPLATLTVDTSRYTNLSQIPNLSVGLMITDDEASDSGGAQMIKNYATDTTADTRTATNGNATNRNTANTLWGEGNGAAIFTAGTHGSGGASESEGVKYNGRWTRAISASSASGRYDIRAGVWNKNGGDWTTGVGGIHVQINMINKISLRNALNNFYKVTGKIGLTANETSAYYNTSSAAWQHAVSLYKSAALFLTDLDTKTSIKVGSTTYNPDQLATALNSAVSGLEDAKLSSTAKLHFVALNKNEAGKYVTGNVIQNGASVASQSEAYAYGNNIGINVPTFAGYNYVGYFDGTNNSINVEVGEDYSALLTGTGNPAAKNFAVDANISQTLFFVPKDLSVTFATDGGKFNLLKAKTSALPTNIGGIGFPSYTAGSAETDINYTIVDNDAIIKTSSATNNQKYQALPFYVDVMPNTQYKLTYSVVGTDESNLEFKFINPAFVNGNTSFADSAVGTAYEVSADGTFTTGENDMGRAYLMVELSGDSRNGKEFRVDDICLTPADLNELKLITSSTYPSSYTPATTVKTGMSYNAVSSNSFTVTSSYSTSLYAQKQLVPYYVDVQPGCTYRFNYNIAGIPAEDVLVELYSASFTGGNSSNGANYYKFNGSGSTVTVSSGDSGLAQLRISYEPTTTAFVAKGVTASFSDIYLENLNTQTVVGGKTTEVYSIGIPVKSGYNFTGWTYSGSLNGSLANITDTNCYDYTFGVDSDTLTATWAPATYTVVFRNPDGSVIKTQEVVNGEAATAPSASQVAPLFGHAFANSWDTDFSNVTGNLYVEPVYDEIDIDVILDKSSTTIYAGHDDTFTASFIPNAAEISNVTWTTNNPNVATVAASGSKGVNGVVTGVAAGTATITATVTYDGRTYSESATVTVQAVKPTDVVISKDPTKTEYFVGDTFDPSGLEVTVTYNDGSTRTYSYGTTYAGITMTIAAVSTTTPGPKTVKLTYKESGITKTPSTSVKVTKVVLESIAIVTPPSVTEYYVGDEDLDLSGLEFKAIYNNGTEETLDESNVEEFTELDSSTAGTQTITISYQSKTATFDVTILPLELESIGIKTMPKTNFYVGDSFDSTGLVLTATYSNGTTADVKTGFTCTGFDSSAAGQKTITVAYEGKTTTYTVNVREVELVSIAVKAAPAKAEYFVGENADYAGLVITATYNNGATEDIANGNEALTLTGFDSATSGQKTITASYGGKTTTFNLTVKAIELVSIAVKTSPAKTSYYAGETADYTGLVITANYNNGTTKDVAFGEEGLTVTGFDSATAGHKTLTVSYGGKTTTFNVTVDAVVVTSIAIKTAPAKTTYFVGDDADYAGLVITATYSNGTTKDVAFGEAGLTVTGFDSSEAGLKTITAAYADKTATFNVTINPVELTEIKVTKLPAKVVYLTGEAADYAGLEITAYYNNGTSAVVTDYTIIGFDSETAGVITLAVNYENKMTSFDVTVNWNYADYSEVDAAIEAAEAEIAKNIYTDDSVASLNTAIDSVERNLLADQQGDVDAMAAAINATINALVLKPLDIIGWNTALNDLTAKGDLKNYTDASVKAVNDANDAVTAFYNEHNFITRQADFNALVAVLSDAINALELKGADYTALDELAAYAANLNPDWFENYYDVYWAGMYELVEETIPSNHDYDILHQADVDTMTEELQGYIDMLEAYGADYAAVDAALNAGDTLAASGNYTAESVASRTIALPEINRDYKIWDQDKVDAYVAEIEAANALLQLKPADYTEVDALVDYVNALVDTAGYDEAKNIQFTNFDDIYWTYMFGFVEETLPDQRGYLKDEQDKVDALRDELQSYIDMLEYEPTEPVEKSVFELTNTATLKNGTYIIGLRYNLTRTDFEKNFTHQENVKITYSNAASRRVVGTGTVVTVTSTLTNEVLAEYTIIIFGDVDGDGSCTALDEGIVTASLKGGARLNAAQTMAADVTGRRAGVDSSDAALMTKIAKKTVTMPQDGTKI